MVLARSTHRTRLARFTARALILAPLVTVFFAPLAWCGQSPPLMTDDHADHGPSLGFWAQLATNELLLSLALLAVLIPLVVVALCRRFPQAAKRDVPVACGLFTVALALRWLLPYHTFIHENRAGLGQVLTGTLEHALVPIGGGLPSSSVTTAWLLYQVLPHNDLAFFLVTAVASSCAVVGLYFLGTLTFASRLAGWSAAVLLSLQPLAIALAPTEEPIVFASGALLLALPLLWLGARESWWLPLLTGVLLLSLAATARDVTLPWVFCLPLVLAAAAPQRHWLVHASGWALLTALVLPDGLAYLTGTRLQAGGAVGLLGVPKLSHWIGWSRPFVPAWMAWSGIGALLWAILVALRTRLWRPALVSIGCVLLLHLTGGLMIGGYFPGHLRHQSAALALLMLPLGGAWAALWTRLRSPQASVVLVVLLGGLSLLATPASYRWDLPPVREYRFLAENIPPLTQRAHVHFYAPTWARSLSIAPWLVAQQPTWQLQPFAEPTALHTLASPDEPHFLILDRSCFAEAPAEASDEARNAWRATPYGLAHAACADALHAANWREVARQPLQPPTRRLPQAADLPSRDARSTLVVLTIPATK